MGYLTQWVVIFSTIGLVNRRGLYGGLLVLFKFLDHGLDLRPTAFGLAVPSADAYLSPQRFER